MTCTVYVVLSHRDWHQTRRLAHAIIRSSPISRVVIMHDSRHERFPDHSDDDRIEIVDHGLATDWGSWELVEAALQGFRIARDAHDADLVTLISGQDYPVRPLDEWEREALAAPSWIGSAHPLQYRPFWGRRRGAGDDRLTRYAYRWLRSPAERLRERLPAAVRIPPGIARAWRRLSWAAALRLEPAFSIRVVARGRGVHYGFRRIPDPFRTAPAWFGSQWLAVRREELDVLLAEYGPRSALRRLYRRTVVPDESALVTPLARIHPPSDLPPVSLDRWEDELDTTATWTLDDLDAIIMAGSPFCRKVDPVISAGLMDALDDRNH